MWRLPIPFCLPLFHAGLAIGLAVAAVGAFLPWAVPLAVLAAMAVSPRLAGWTEMIHLKGRTFDARLSVAESIARRFRRPHRARVDLAVRAAIWVVALVAAPTLIAAAVLPDGALSGVAGFVRETLYWRLFYDIGLPLSDAHRIVGHSGYLRLVEGEAGLLWPPLCAFAAAAVALPLWLGAMTDGFEAVDGPAGWARFAAAAAAAIALPLFGFGIFMITGLSPQGPVPPVGFVAGVWLVLPLAWGMALGRLANVGTLLAALLSRHGHRRGR